MKYASVHDFLSHVALRNPGQPEFLQAVTEVMESLWPFIAAHPKYAEQGLLDRLVEPERIVIFRVSWVDDHGSVQVNKGYRIQHSMAIGPYKGGLRFHPSVNLSVLKFLAFEQTFKNALTTLPMGGGKGGSDFDPKGKSPAEVMRFCQAFASELFRHVGADTDVPAGDIGVGGREVGFIAGMVKKLSNRADCVFTGKGLAFGGSLVRPEATGYGTVYFAQEMLKTQGKSFDGLRVSVSGSGNVAQYAVQKALELGARVITVSDSSGTIVDEAGFTAEKLAILMDVKNHHYGRVSDYAERTGVKFEAGVRPWHVPVDVALPCATQNELDGNDARTLIGNGVLCVAEGANMPSTIEAAKAFEAAGVLYAPGKASNAGGVATSGLEMSQNALRLSWPREEVDGRLLQIMQGIHAACLAHGKRADGSVSYIDGANIAGFVKVADAMLAQGVI
ncbi:MAG: glutamate dehydrogenase [Burkholderiales bacterium RIFCSPHIGHO2_02_FULL_66_10]|uniref:NADP-specific glutamate dehydrogenase n=1 Tax=Hydrogenophaga sp. TaxID=1904254 RepID=UPI0008C09F1F|nr:NADP-specific glutamate dehydrogenase [Hydrogenophaga sp.]MBU4183251.1 NADP-specific glutamate dehydrogenase [Gammaproteobacteria bacterium]OGB32279.1 MAG: glutamate dehydrogenase [Burkholderiales bacterium RIFCSPLOWO2_02_FULL_66_35]OGB34027.1 MAG: glutamate dehydrogenase [Burkholderiales bacterium RIFCSPHIGHO2_02_FULL_66_10]MBU4283138.1 NADP-specific glutamate dehydrogenase [Gammaproteobacteria bacterium]MBU4507941.1 NADP-specific glutamate dehydrogenase [Gammaproteobacteria bacterium]